MYITQIELINFQQHKHLVISLIDGVNIFQGKTAIGKSTVLHAIGWVMGETMAKEAILPWFTDENLTAEVILTFDEGTIIKRLVSKTINAYEFTPKGIGDLVRFDSFGKTLPELISDYLNLPIMTIDKEEILLNVQSQHESHFLLSKPDTYKNKVLNILTGNDALDKVGQSFNKDLLALSKDNRRLKESAEIKVKEVKILKSDLKPLEDKLERAKILLLTIDKQQEKLDKVKTLLVNYKQSIADKESLTNQIKALKIIDLSKIEEYKALADKLDQVRLLLGERKQTLVNVEEIKQELKELKFVDLDFDQYIKLADKYNRVVNLLTELKKLKSNKFQLDMEIEDIVIITLDFKCQYELIEKIEKVKVLLVDYKRIKLSAEDLKGKIVKSSNEIKVLKGRYNELLGKLPNEECRDCPLVRLS